MVAHQRLESTQRAGSRRMVPRAERLGRLDNDRRAAKLILATPRRHDQETFADAKWPEAFHPQRRPSRIDDSFHHAVARIINEQTRIVHYEPQSLQLRRRNRFEVSFERDELVFVFLRTGTWQRHPR